MDRPARIRGRQGGTTFLMYHEIAVPGRALSRDFRGHLAYAVPEAELRSQLQYLQDKHWRGICVSEALNANASNNTQIDVVITFDDGSETDLLTAAPLLEKMNFKATFYVIAGWLGKSGYLSGRQVRALQAQGFEIGCHSMNHTYLTALSDADLYAETAEAKARLEQILGVQVNHLSCPGGFWNRRVAGAAKRCGYFSLATSRTAVNTGQTDPYCLARISMMRGTALADFDRFCRGDGLVGRQIKDAVLSVPKFVLGANSYVRVHSALHRV